MVNLKWNYNTANKMKSILPLIFMLLIEHLNAQNLQKAIGVESNVIMSHKEIRSVSIGVVKGGEIYKLHKGKLLNNEIPTDSTLYEIASLTKTFTGTLLAKAILDEKVKVDDDIRKHLPETFPNLECNGRPIKFRHLVTHTSGLPNMFPDKPEIFDNSNWDELPFVINDLQKGFSKSQFISELRKVRLDTMPGFRFAYSNVGANLIGFCLERLYHKPYQELVQEYILKPLEMNNTFVKLPREKIRVVAKGINANGVEMPLAVEKELSAEGGIVSSLDDMIKYMKFQLDNKNPLISIAHQELLDGKFGDFENGIFWQIFKNGEKPDKVFQNGGAFGTSCWMALIPESQIGVFIITNVSGPDIHQKLSMSADNIIKLIQ